MMSVDDEGRLGRAPARAAVRPRRGAARWRSTAGGVVPRAPRPAGTTVSGVAVGGMSRPRQGHPHARSARPRRRPITLSAGESPCSRPWPPARVDVPGTVDGLIGFASPGRHVGPPHRRRGAAGGRDHRRHAAFAATVKAREQLDTAAVRARISLKRGKVTVVGPSPAPTTDVPGTADEVAARWPAPGAVAVERGTGLPPCPPTSWPGVKSSPTPPSRARSPSPANGKSFTLAPRRSPPRSA